eukprot:TRINITY_DN536_c0_g1_i6.p1 TRINITY_DN536_c0_g1~~TRINITY_DN536_c0_g1_i6.p1  ORF type:complete len:339 (-),score=48.81 TRINITY_DN536_c0_g1_i6:174-1190(-)
MSATDRFHLNGMTWYLFTIFVLSILGSLFIILSYYKFKELRDHLLKCVLFISISDLIYTTVFFICYFVRLDMPSDSSSETPTPICMVEAVFLEQFIIASWIWPACFAFQLYQHIVRGTQINRFRYFHIISWGIPLICNIVLISTKSYGPPKSGLGWCWIKPTLPLFEFIFGYGILGILLIFETILYIAIVIHIRRQLMAFSLLPGSRVMVVNQLEGQSNRLTWYLLVPLLCWSWGLANRIYQAVSDDPDATWLGIMQGCFAASQGFWNAVIYLFNSKLRVMWSNTILRKIPFVSHYETTTTGDYDTTDPTSPLMSVDKSINRHSQDLFTYPGQTRVSL